MTPNDFHELVIRALIAILKATPSIIRAIKGSKRKNNKKRKEGEE